MVKKSKTKKVRPYIDVNLPREWEPYLKEALENPAIQKKIEISGFSKTYSGLGNWLIREFLIEKTSFHFRHFNTYENHITIIDNKIRRVINIYPKEPDQLWCEHCDSLDCEHVHFVLTLPRVRQTMEKKGWKLPEV